MRFVHIAPTFPCCYPHNSSWNPMLEMIGRQRAKGRDPVVIIPASQHLPETFGGAATLTRGLPKAITLNGVRVFAVAPENAHRETLYRFDDINPSNKIFHALEKALFEENFSLALGGMFLRTEFLFWGQKDTYRKVYFWGGIMNEPYGRFQKNLAFSITHGLPSANRAQKIILHYNGLGQQLEIVEDELAARRNRELPIAPYRLGHLETSSPY